MKKSHYMLPMNLTDWIALILSVALLLFGLFSACLTLNTWASKTFAQPFLASCLIAVVELTLFALVFALTPVLSQTFRLVIRRVFPQKNNR